ncbi:MAG: alpha-amylase family glycosyl hydrolase [Gemmatimonadales bacterium]|nr:alpha-amylase family glycosyl hydrolase [Gemmatimonadales bacterium]
MPLLLGAVLGAAAAPACCTVTLSVRVPTGTGAVYVAGNLPSLGPWKADAQRLDGTGRERRVSLVVPAGTALEYKFTLGSWEREALTFAGVVPPNHRLTVASDTTVAHDIADFKRPVSAYLDDWRGSGVRGRLVHWRDVRSAHLGPARHVSVWLPPGYDRDTTRRYPVLYMHDGQNLFDPRIANTGTDWGVDEAVTRLVARGEIPPVIVVGVWSTAARGPEYSPWHDAPRYARFLIEELMPRVEGGFRVRRGPSFTFVMGSSMGGLLSMYLVREHPDRFGGCGCLSTHFPLSPAWAARFLGEPGAPAADSTPYIDRDIARGVTLPRGPRYWFDHGTTGLDASYAPTHARVRDWLLRTGLAEGRDFVVRRYDGADHNEAAWRARLDDPLRFLLAPLATRGRTPADAAPAWAADARWYQVFVERFRNGDPRNDPTPDDMVGVTDEPTPPGWRVTPWGHDWYAQEPWARATGRPFQGTVQFRRYGGDLQGLLDRLDTLRAFGVNALYVNPVNDAPSLHKYDARSYVHIDRTFGPDPRGDAARIAAEDAADPRTWTFTAADSLFLRLVREVHRRGMRIIVDYSWNHTGIMFPAWRDVLLQQSRSAYAGWYEVERLDDPATPDTNEFRYRGWAGVPWLPEWRKVGRPEGKVAGAIEGTLARGPRDMIMAVTRRWLDPDGDGDPSDGVDGFRLDVADVVPLGFWRDYRAVVKGINPDALLVGEVWWERWPDRLYDPAPWLQGDVFDAVMHYQWFTPTRAFFARAQPALSATQFARALDSLARGVPPTFRTALMNLAASHDTPRFATAMLNRGVNKYRATPREDPAYDIGPPDAATRRRMVQLLVQQVTWWGAPHVWNGDEYGMWGADDPDDRKPLVWPDLAYDDEVADPLGRPRTPVPVRADTALRRTWAGLLALRAAHPRLFADGTVTWRVTDDARRLVAYERRLGAERAFVAFNAGDAPATFTLPDGVRWRRAWPTDAAMAGRTARLDAESAAVWVAEPRRASRRGGG